MRHKLFMGALGALMMAACAENTGTAGQGTVLVRMTDAPLAIDSVQSINMFVTRVDAKMEESDSLEASQGAEDDSAGKGGWRTLATPNANYNLKNLQNGVSTLLGGATLEAGTYKSLRLILDPAKSNVVMNNGTTYSGTSNPGIVFPSASKTGIKVQLVNSLTVVAGDTTNVLLDFDASQSLVVRGNTIAEMGLLFKPVIKATSSR